MKSHAALRERLALLLLLLATSARADEPVALSPDFFAALPARSIGPANMGGRVVAVAVVESRPTTMFVATASGGLWRTVNNGTTWTPVLDHEETASLGAVAVAPSNPEVVWAGTGEANARNSVSWGSGVYKSTDGGRTWRNMGLRDTHHIGRVAIDPSNADVVYVAALGHLWGPNRERGVFKTTDGGRTWRQVMFLDEETGCIDLALDPGRPSVVYAAAYRVRRDAFAGGNPAVQFSRTAGLYKSADGGETWTKLTRGLPDRPYGRCGIAVSRTDPRVVYAVVQTDKTDIRTVPGQAARSGEEVEIGGVFRSEDKGRTWRKVNDLCPRPFYFGQIRVDPNNDQRVYVLGLALHVSRDGGRTFTDGGSSVHADHHALWIDPRNSSHLVLGCDGGLYVSYDRGAAWEHIRNLPIAQFYAVAVDTRKPYRVYGGLQDNGTWGGPSATRNREGITAADWVKVAGGDGFYCAVDPTDPDTVYVEGQYGRLQRFNVRTGAGEAISPRPTLRLPNATLPTNVSPPSRPDAPAFRFNWSSPLLLSPHNPRTLYYGGNHLFRSFDRGLQWQILSPDLTRGKAWPNAHAGHTITTISESPLRPGLLYVGTDDGRLHVRGRGGKPEWIDLSDRLPDLPAARWVTRVEASRHAAGTVYVTVDRHRNDDRAPYVFRSRDFGETWTPLAAGLPPEGPVHLIREGLRNPALLYVGTEFGLFVSLDGGASWTRFGRSLPTVAVHDLVVHPRDQELVVATHGRSLYVVDVAPLEELTPAVLRADAHLFRIKSATAFRFRGAQGRGGGKPFAGTNPPYGAVIYYYLKTAPTGPVELSVADARGNVVARLNAAAEAGLHRVTWSLTRDDPPTPGALVPAGEYVVRLRVGDQTRLQRVRVEAEE
jgi:photosystem II stability/assembly factor-like uncharacterized protein